MGTHVDDVARPIRLPSHDAMRATRQRVATAVEAWRAQWGLRQPAGSVECRQVESPDRRLAWMAVEGADPAVWICVPDDLESRVRHWLFGMDESRALSSREAAPISSEVARGALRCLTDGIAQAALPPDRHSLEGVRSTGDGGPDPTVFERYAASTLLTVSLAGLVALRCLVSADHRRAPRAGSVAVAPLTAALHAQPVHLSLVIGELPMTLEQLARASVGDVLMLPARIDQPLEVRLDDGTVACHAFIGKRAQRPAMRVTASRESLKPIPSEVHP